ncbi:poly-gamma-glutamate synthesis protein (capsule biosynthesis protein) [Paenibacillus sp. UNCCL117]|nr:poly-gamma-glutamate synthesis protein (capsule biosynthesis protein) [Paenibacillus sp. cl123]SFW18676.1 poly-gamma-glutamate synthesis protein (capsule biosynthesis protein) [Paenibacillus sp. UNCCL117]
MIQSRTEKHKSEKKDHKTLWLKIAVLSVITMGAFAYLIQWLEAGQEAGKLPVESSVALAKPPAEAPPANPITPSTGSPWLSSGEKLALDGSSQLQTPAEEAPAGGGQISMTFVGDVMFAGKVEELLAKNGYEYPFKYVKPYLEKADITVANLETPITLRGDAQSKEYVYRSSPLALPELKKAGVDLVNLANNHSMDYGEVGLVDTLDHLDEQGILRVGGGRTAEEAYKHVVVERQGMKVAFLGFTRVLPETSWIATAKKPGLAAAHTSKATLEAVANARKEADLVVVIAHWGEERKSHPVSIQTDLAHQFIDAGADLVIASHPHVPQGFEQYKGKWVAYSLGNFIFTTNDVPETWDSMILNAACTKERSCEISLVPILTKWAQPIRMVEDQAQKLFERLTKNSINAKVNAQGAVALGPVRTFPATVVKPPVTKEANATSGAKTEPTKKSPATKETTGTSPTKTDPAKKTPATSDTKTPETKKPAGASADNKKSTGQPAGSGKSGSTDKSTGSTSKNKSDDSKSTQGGASKAADGTKSSSSAGKPASAAGSP